MLNRPLPSRRGFVQGRAPCPAGKEGGSHAAATARRGATKTGRIRAGVQGECPQQGAREEAGPAAESHPQREAYRPAQEKVRTVNTPASDLRSPEHIPAHINP